MTQSLAPASNDPPDRRKPAEPRASAVASSPPEGGPVGGGSPSIRVSALGLLGTVVVAAILFVARDVILPLVLAGMLSFVLAPMVRWFERLGLPRVVSVILVSVSVFALLAGLLFFIGKQLNDLAGHLPSYKGNLVTKIEELKKRADNPLSRATRTIEEIAEETQTPESAAEERAPAKVEVVQRSGPLDSVAAVIRPLAAPLGQAAVVIVLVIFMLVSREDVRDRVLHLAGRSRLRLTTQAVNDAGRRVTRYLLAETLVNIGYAVVTGVGLFFIGIPNAMLWGALAGMLRFLPYVGPWLGAACPILLSLAISQSWHQPMMTIGLFVVIELIGNNFVEPWAYGTSTGLAPLAIIISAIFWTWLWGVFGLVLATPLTVCAMVVGQHVPGLWFLDVLLSERPPIATVDRVYQRLLAPDPEEVIKLIEEEVKERPLAEAFDRTALAALCAEEYDYRRGLMTDEGREKFLMALRPLVETIGAAARVPEVTGKPILCLPTSDEADELAGMMLEHSLRARGMAAETASARKLISEMVASAGESEPAIIVMSMVSPNSEPAGVSLCHRLRAALPDCYLVAGLWDAEGEAAERLRSRMEGAGANLVCYTLERAVASLSGIV